MGSALNSVMGGGGGSILGAVGGIVGGIFGGPIGAMIGQAIGNMLQQAIGDALKGAVDHLQQEHGMPKFLADEAKGKIDDVLGQLKHDVPADVQNACQTRYGDAFKDFAKEFEQNLIRNVLDGLGDADGKSTNGKGAGSKGGGWLQAIAKAMGQTLGNKAAEMVKLSNKMSELDQAKGDDEQAAKEFNETMTKFQATGQEYSMLNNVFSTAIKALGEALSAMARKQ
jgi:hypothetical protein